MRQMQGVISVVGWDLLPIQVEKHADVATSQGQFRFNVNSETRIERNAALDLVSYQSYSVSISIVYALIHSSG